MTRRLDGLHGFRVGSHQPIVVVLGTVHVVESLTLHLMLRGHELLSISLRLLLRYKILAWLLLLDALGDQVVEVIADNHG